MEYIVVPFTANVTRYSDENEVSNQLETLIKVSAVDGYEFYSLEDITTNVEPFNGCFGFGARPGYTTTIQCIVLRKQ